MRSGLQLGRALWQFARKSSCRAAVGASDRRLLSTVCVSWSCDVFASVTELSTTALFPVADSDKDDVKEQSHSVSDGDSDYEL